MLERWLFIFLLIVFAGCSKNPEEVNIYSIPDEFKIDLHQAVSIEGTYPAFQVSTLDSRTCNNDRIIVTISKVGSGVKIDIIDIDQALTCNNESGRITTDVYAILDPGVYTISVSLKDQVSNEGFITVTDELFKLNLGTDHGIELGKTNILKIPDGLIWGYNISTPGISSIGNSLLDRLNPYMRTVDQLASGDYGLFTVENKDSYTINTGNHQNIDHQFLMEINTSISEIKEIVRQFREENPDSEFKVYTSRGIIN